MCPYLCRPFYDKSIPISNYSHIPICQTSKRTICTSVTTNKPNQNENADYYLSNRNHFLIYDEITYKQRIKNSCPKKYNLLKINKLQIFSNNFILKKYSKNSTNLTISKKNMHFVDFFVNFIDILI